MVFSGGIVVKNPPDNAGDTRLGFNSWVGKILWKRKWQPSPVFLPGESHGHGIAKSWTGLSDFTFTLCGWIMTMHTHHRRMEARQRAGCWGVWTLSQRGVIEKCWERKWHGQIYALEKKKNRCICRVEGGLGTARGKGRRQLGNWQGHLGAQKHRIRGLFGCRKVNHGGGKWRWIPDGFLVQPIECWTWKFHEIEN